MKDVSAMLGAAFSSNHQSLVVEPFDRFAYGIHDPSLLSGFYSCERCSRCPLADYLGLSLIRYLKNCPAVENLHVQSSAGLILPFLTVPLVETEILPTDGANYKGGVWGPGPASRRFWLKRPSTMNL